MPPPIVSSYTICPYILAAIPVAQSRIPLDLIKSSFVWANRHESSCNVAFAHAPRVPMGPLPHNIQTIEYTVPPERETAPYTYNLEGCDTCARLSCRWSSPHACCISYAYTANKKRSLARTWFNCDENMLSFVPCITSGSLFCVLRNHATYRIAKCPTAD